MRLWHPHTERPTCICSCLIALPPALPEDPFQFAGSYYTYDPKTDRFRCETTDVPLIASSFFWAAESDVLAELEATR